MNTTTMPQHTRDDQSFSYGTTANPTDQVYYSGYLGSSGVSGNHGGSLNGVANSTESFNEPSGFQQYGGYARQYTPQSDPYLHQTEAREHSAINNSMSPSTMNEQFSPEAFLSDASIHDHSSYNSPRYDDPFLEGSFNPMVNLQGGVGPQVPPQFDGFHAQNEQMGGFNNHLAPSTSYARSPVPSNAAIPSPQSTHRSSPAIAQGYGQSHANPSTLSHEALFATPNLQHMTANPNHQQPSPALTASSAAVSSSDVSSQLHLVVTIDDYADENQNQMGLTRSLSKRSHGGKRTNTHLSPYVHEESSEDGEVPDRLENTDSHLNSTEHSSSQNFQNHVFLADGAAQRTGINPDSRLSINTENMSTLEEQEEQRHLIEKNAEVTEWLTRSAVGSDAEDHNDTVKKPRKKRSHGRPRARSTNDAAFGNNAAGLGVSNPVFDDSLIPGPGLYINEASDIGDDSYSESDEESGSPVAPVAAFRDEEEYFPAFDSSVSLPRSQLPVERTPNATDQPDITQGITANLAIMRFRQRAKETDNASLTATIGSRRRSESDIVSVVNSAGISKFLLSPPTVQEQRKNVRRRGSFLENILPNRNNSNKMKRKNSQQPDTSDQVTSPKEGSNGFAAPKRIGSFGRPKSPRVDTNLSTVTSESRSPNTVAAAASGAFAHAKQIWRSRSRSDLSKPAKPNMRPGLADLWTQSGGPPMPTLASPLNTHSSLQAPAVNDGEEDSADEDGADPGGIAMELSVRTDMRVIPTYDGFKYQARQLNPRLADFLLERITQEQLKRFKRLVDVKFKHSQNVTSGSCTSKTFCFASGGEWKELPPRAGTKDPDATLVGFQILGPGMTEDDVEASGDGSTVAAQFPPGVPLPPVKHLPAEFECPLCFKVKKFYKPSDWTKHVHEDIQPFTCTFAGCNEPKSFKRKADWVRHENERHRQLESWTCNISECTHTCYRKDNFVQHLVREHKVPEPKVRTGRNNGSKSPATPYETTQPWKEEVIEDVWALVEECHADATKQPKDEPCKFCGNICSSWKKLTVHLAKHMEQISMPVLTLVEQKRVATDAASLPHKQPFMAVLPTKPQGDLPTFLCDEPMEMDMDTPGIAVNGVASNVMHSYPPTMAAFQGMNNTQNSTLTSPAESYAGQSYPQPSVTSRSRAASFNSTLSVSRQGTTFPPAGMTSQEMQYDDPQAFFPPSSGYLPSGGMGNNTYLTPTSGAPANLGYNYGYQR